MVRVFIEGGVCQGRGLHTGTALETVFTYVHVVHKLHGNGESRCGKAH